MTRSRVVVVAILAAASLGGWRLGQAHRTATAPWTVVDVVDGDTIEVARGDSTDTVRLLGIDTPKPRNCHLPPVAFQGRADTPNRRQSTVGDLQDARLATNRSLVAVMDGRHDEGPGDRRHDGRGGQAVGGRHEDGHRGDGTTD